MSLHSHQTINGETTAFKCWRSVRATGETKRGKPVYRDCVYVEIYEGYDKPGWAGGNARRTTHLRLTKELLEELSRDFAQLAEHGEPDESPQNANMKEFARALVAGELE